MHRTKIPRLKGYKITKVGDVTKINVTSLFLLYRKVLYENFLYNKKALCMDAQKRIW